MSDPTIRPVRPDEREAWEGLWSGYLDFYRAAIGPEMRDLTWSRLHDPLVPLHALVAEADGETVGLVHYLFHASAWTRGPYCYLQDLFTAPEARGRGIARALIEAVTAQARHAGADRVHWLTMEDNTQARALYDRLADRSGFIQYRRILGPG
ncbi:GNAT family N-acetyltransferase [Methylobacterium sp. Leaf85]|uniref:GNAT family N-acetyltransferase n=1 Tax=Methylobacterium sp. Leaf85 TaxID=1736241 RepID=UPI0006F2F703|nr:GNAT family N-acetyltransferase [Methylobacterium sp. Leaf85]KQO51936.1 GNAT family acetyltransferase [Methylobacterium sp. Leaf85]